MAPFSAELDSPASPAAAAGESAGAAERGPAAPGDAHYLAHLSRTAMELAALPPEQDIYRLIALRLRELVGDAVVVVASYDAATREMCQQALEGAGSILDAASALAGTRLLGYRRTMNEAAATQMSVGRLLQIGEGLYEALFRAVPKTVTRSIEKLAGIHSVYGMGCVANGECFGCVLILLRRNAVLPPAEVVEAYINQAAVTMQRRRAELALRRSEERHRTLMEQAPDAYLVLDTAGAILEVNNRTCRALGYPREQIVGRLVTDFMDRNELAAKPLRIEALGSRQSLAGTRRMRRADGSTALFEAHAVPLPDGQVLISARDITDRRRLEDEVLDTDRRAREALGQDLHDSLGQQLTGIAYLSKAMERRLAERNAPEAEDAARIAEIARESVEQTRRIAHGLCQVELSAEGLSDALKSLAMGIRDTFKVRCDFACCASCPSPRKSAALHLYLIAQEAATNAVRHGQATVIRIAVSARNGHGQLLISDNGSGFPAGAEDKGGLGLRIMRYRAEIIDGALTVRSSRSGTMVFCTFPLPPSGECAG